MLTIAHFLFLFFTIHILVIIHEWFFPVIEDDEFIFIGLSVSTVILFILLFLVHIYF